MGNPPVTGGFPSQRVSNAENVSIWWRPHVQFNLFIMVASMIYFTIHSIHFIIHTIHSRKMLFVSIMPHNYWDCTGKKIIKNRSVKHSSCTFCISNCFKGLLFNTHEDLLSLWVKVIQMSGLSLILKKLVTVYTIVTWGRHQMDTFSALLALCTGNSPVTGKFSSQMPVTPSFDVVTQFKTLIRLHWHILKYPSKWVGSEK